MELLRHRAIRALLGFARSASSPRRRLARELCDPRTLVAKALVAQGRFLGSGGVAGAAVRVD
jgi:hypothetical protein